MKHKIKQSKVVGEFTEFALKTKFLDLSLGVVMGGGISAIINAFLSNLFKPVLGLFIGNMDLEDLFFALDGSHYETLAQAQAANALTINYGLLIGAIIDFLVLALSAFLIVKAINRIRSRIAVQQEEASQICPFCKSEIPRDATRCKFCTSQLPRPEDGDSKPLPLTEQE